MELTTRGQEELGRFWEDILSELLRATVREYPSSTLPHAERMRSIFLETFRRIDFDTLEVAASAGHSRFEEWNPVELAKLAMQFGSFLEKMKIELNPEMDFGEESDDQ